VLKKKLIFVRPDNQPLPRAFWLRVDLDVSSGIDLKTCPLRIYFDFIGALFPAHCARPPVRRGVNYFFVETSGKAAALAFGPLQVPARFRLEAAAYEAAPEDAELLPRISIPDDVRRPDVQR
jgi:hypothetical protein